MQQRPNVLVATTILLAALFAAPLPAQDKGKDGEAKSQESTSKSSSRTADPDELKELLADFKTAEKSKEYAALTAMLVRLAGFNNPELNKAVEAGLEYKASKKDEADAKVEAKALGMDDKLTMARLTEMRVAEVVGAAAELAVKIGDEKSVELLVDAVKDKKIFQNNPAIAAVVDALGRHPLADGSVDKKIAAILYAIDADDLAGDQYDYSKPEAAVPGYDELGKYRAAIRYFGLRKSKDFAVAVYLAGLLRAPRPDSPDSPDNPPAAYWEKRHNAWMRYNRDAVWSLREMTGQTWKAGHDDEGGQSEEAIAWLYENKKNFE